MEQASAVNLLELTVPLYSYPSLSVSPQNSSAVQVVVPDFLCPSDHGQAVSLNPLFGPTNYAACAGSGGTGSYAGSPGSPLPTDGIFGINSQVRTKQVQDGTSKTALFSETRMAPAPGSSVSIAHDPQTQYVFILAAPLTDAKCAASSNWSQNTLYPTGFAWVSGEFRCTLYNHHNLPNSQTPDCMGEFSGGGSYTGVQYALIDYGWRAARSLHPGGINLALADGSVQFIANEIDLPTWQALSTMAGGELFTLP